MKKPGEAFIKSKEKIWKEHGYGPWAFLDDGKFIGWGGLQPDQGNVEVAIVLHPNSWGMGKVILKRILDFAFNQLDEMTDAAVHPEIGEKCRLKSVTILFPPTRTRIK